MSHANEVSSLTYEQARDELIAIVAKLEAGAATLDESVGLWERGEALAARCQELLEGARDRITDARGEGDEDDDIADAGIVGLVPADDVSDDDASDDSAATRKETDS